jgi:hypothetical protein
MWKGGVVEALLGQRRRGASSCAVAAARGLEPSERSRWLRRERSSGWSRAELSVSSGLDAPRLLTPAALALRQITLGTAGPLDGWTRAELLTVTAFVVSRTAARPGDRFDSSVIQPRLRSQ